MILPPDIAALIASLQRELEGLRAENAELRRRLGLDSSTSSKPPSSDGLKKPRAPLSLREPSGRPGGGQKGHKGETLRQSADPDWIVRRAVPACRHCGSGLNAAMAIGMERRQVFDLAERLLEVTEHQGLVYACAACGGRTRAAFPDGVTGPAQYGERVKAAGVYLHAQQLIPEDRTAEALADLFGAQSLSPASVAQWTTRRAKAFLPVAAEMGAQASAARVRCLDETGFRVASRTQWLHTVATDRLTLYRVSARRGDMPKGFEGGIVVHDGFKPYVSRLPGLAHALCNAHHLRELKALIAFDGEPWATSMRDLLLEANRAVAEARKRGAARLAPDLLAAFHERYWAALREGLAHHRKLPRLPRQTGNRGKAKRRPGHNLLIRLHKFKDDVLRFLIDFGVPFTNNLAEQALRMMKVKMKISGAFRTDEGAQAFAILRSIIATAAKQRHNILKTIATNPDQLIKAFSP
jgi:transposase